MRPAPIEEQNPSYFMEPVYGSERVMFKSGELSESNPFTDALAMVDAKQGPRPELDSMFSDLVDFCTRLCPQAKHKKNFGRKTVSHFC